jgi:tetratricopeptide (TPR) repeat protein
MIDASASPRALELFFSYAHEDEPYRERLQKHLSTLRNEGLIVDWYDGKIQPGTDWDTEIRMHLGRADIVLFLVSADFLASDYIGRVEIAEALTRHHAGAARVIPVVVNPCDWSTTSLAKLEALPEKAKPISTWPNAEEAYLDVAKGIRAAAETLLAERQGVERARTRATLKRVAVAMVELTVGSGDVERRAVALTEASDAVAKLLTDNGAAVDALHPDEVTAVFGLPRLHDDDTLRAVRALADLQSRVPAVSRQLEQRLGVTVTARSALDVGILLMDDSGAVAAAARTAAGGARSLLRRADDGDVLIGDDAFRIVGHAVRTESVAAGATVAHRLTDVLPDADVRPLRPRSALVGRDWERALVRKTFERTIADRSCRLLVLTGPPGIGKSRLVQECTRSLAGRGVVLRGACSDSHAAYWPLLEIVKQAAGAEPSEPIERAVERIAGLLNGESSALEDARAIAGLVDLAQPSSDAEATSRAVRRLFESIAAKTPLVVVLDDIHLATPAFLDLLIDVADQSYGVPLLLLCLAWPELDDRHPQWGENLATTTRIRLEPLVGEDAAELVGNLLPGSVDETLRARITDATAGNPFFVEELVAMLVDHGHIAPEDGVWRAVGALPQDLFPDTVDAVMAARLDGLPDDERSVLAAGSVEGMRFHEDVVQRLTALSAEQLEDALAGLARKELVHRDRAEFRGEAYAFRHVLIRETAYEGIPKGARADLHEAFTGWVEANLGDRVWEYEEMLGYHLERAHALREDVVGSGDPSLAELGRRAGGHLASAGRRAIARGDMADARALLERAAALGSPDDPGRARLLLDLGVAQMETGALRQAIATYDAAVDEARAAGDTRTEWYALIQRSGVAADLDPEVGTAALTAEASEAFRVFTELGDDLGLAKVWHRRGFVAAVACRWRDTQDAFEHARRHAGRAGADRDEAVASSMLFYCFVLGPEPVEDALRRSEAIVAETRFRGVAGVGLAALGNLHAMRGSFDDARASLEQSRQILEDLGQTRRLIEASFFAASAELLADEVDVAVEHLRRAKSAATAAGQRGLLSSIDAHLAEALFALGRHDEAGELALAAADAAEDDVFVQMRWRPVYAKVLAHRGDLDAALVLASEAVGRAAMTDSLGAHASALADHAEVLVLAGREEDGRRAAAMAADLYRQKGNVVGERRVRATLGEREPVA